MPRVDRVIESLLEAGAVSVKNPRFKQIVEEIEYALYPPKHERYAPPYGCIFTDKRIEDKCDCLVIDKLELKLARQLADGISKFAICHLGEFKWIASNSSMSDDELNLIDLVRSWEGTMVHRSKMGSVKIFTNEAIYLSERGEWTRRPYSDSVLSQVRNQAPQADYSILRSLLSFAFHVLSPENVGATLMWWLTPHRFTSSGVIYLSEANINILTKDTLPAIRAILRQHDGAAQFSSSGTLKSIGYQLQYSAKARKLINKTGGTRHTSAQRFSYDERRVIILVVSEDGPVSVFSDGIKVTELTQNNYGELAGMLRKLVPAKKDDVFDECFVAICPKCKKNIEIEVVTILGWKERETANCPICGTELHSANCHAIHTRVVKRLP